MKKTTLLMTGLVCTSILVGGTSPVFAADGEAVTKGEVTFTEDGDGGGFAVDPDIYNTDITGVTVPEGVAGTGVRRIQYVTNFAFGSQKISATNQIYDAKVVQFVPNKPEEGEAKAPYYLSNFVQVADTSGTHEGWELKVKTTTFNLLTETDTTRKADNELKGAELRLSGFTEGNATGDGPVGTTTLPSNDTDKAYKAITSSPEVIYSAAKDKGMGLHTLLLGAKGLDQDNTTADSTSKGVQLYVPSTAQARKGNYSADLTWTMTAGPSL